MKKVDENKILRDYKLLDEKREIERVEKLKSVNEKVKAKLLEVEPTIRAEITKEIDCEVDKKYDGKKEFLEQYLYDAIEEVVEEKIEVPQETVVEPIEEEYVPTMQ